jgi:hypothetical protein
VRPQCEREPPLCAVGRPPAFICRGVQIGTFCAVPYCPAARVRTAGLAGPGLRPEPARSGRRGVGSRSCPGSGPGARRRCGRLMNSSAAIWASVRPRATRGDQLPLPGANLPESRRRRDCDALRSSVSSGAYLAAAARLIVAAPQHGSGRVRAPGELCAGAGAAGASMRTGPRTMHRRLHMATCTAVRVHLRFSPSLDSIQGTMSGLSLRMTAIVSWSRFRVAATTSAGVRASHWLADRSAKWSLRNSSSICTGSSPMASK